MSLEISYREKEQLLKSKLKDELADLIRKQQADVEALKAQFAEIQAILEQKYNEVSDLYENRPSRKEDLVLIKKLKKDNAMKDEQLKKAAEDMKMYKLELEN